MTRVLVCTLLGVALTLAATSSRGSEGDERVFPWQLPGLQKTVVKGASTSIGNLGLGVSNLGWFGNLLNPTVTYPSCEYPLNSNVEHMFLAGIWIGAVDSEGNIRVSAGAEDTGASATSPKQEFGPRIEDKLVPRSSNPLSPNFSTSALADQDLELTYDDFNAGGGGSTFDPHVPMGVRVHTRVLAYAPSYADDFVILLFEVENISGRDLTDLYLGWYNELTVGNIALTVPGADTDGWNFYDDVNGFIDRGQLQEDPEARIMYCYDEDGEDGAAKSWIGVRLLGSDVDPEGEVFSYRQWRFGATAETDSAKYDLMSSGRVDQGMVGGTNYGAVGNWISMFSVGPWPSLFPNETASFALAYVAGADSTEMVQNSQVAQSTFDNGFELPSGPPSPRLEVLPGNNRVTLRWDPGEEPEPGEYDATLASPEYHRSSFTNEYDFQGYRIYRILGEEISGDPFEEASVIAEFDRVRWPDGTVDDVGYNIGLPKADEQGRRVFVDEGVLNGFTYRYAVTSYAARDPRLGLPELESGFNENSITVTPGSAAAPLDEPGRAPVGVYPNPYRGGGAFDRRFSSGEPRELGRLIYFTNVPPRARISVYNLSGARIDVIEHDDPSSGQVEWNMLSEQTRAIAPGLYVYVVEDLDTGEEQRGKLVILK